MHVPEAPVLADLWLDDRTGHYKTSPAKGRRGKRLPPVGYASGIGVPGRPAKLLAGPVLKSDETMFAYSRDALAGPDSSKSGRLVKAAAEKPAKEGEVPAPSTSSSSSSSSRDSTSAESGEAGADRTVRQRETVATKKSVM